MSTTPRDGHQSSTTLATIEECQTLFCHWRLTIMGNLTSNQRLPPAVGGYFFRRSTDPTAVGSPIPLGEVRRTLLGVLNRVDLTDEERLVVRLYYGLDGLPLPFSSKTGPDIAGGRDESSPRKTCRAALAKVAGRLVAKPLAAVPRRPVASPLLEPWFRMNVLTRGEKVSVVARAYVRAVSQCDGPHAAPTVAALARWYDSSGYADPDLQATYPRRSRRPNRSMLARAAALMEIALHEEVLQPRDRSAVRRDPPIPASAALVSTRLIESVTHPALRTLLDDDLSPTELTQAAAVLREKALEGEEVSGQLILFLRCVRPRLDTFPPDELERLAVSISYAAVARGDPFLALEWLGHFLSRVGVTDRTFTVLVNASEAASVGGFHSLAARVDRLFGDLRVSWEIPACQIPRVEQTEAEQQRLVAASFRLEHLGADQARSGDLSGAIVSLRRSVQLASTSAGMAHRVLTDDATFPAVELDDKAGRHGGDMTWPWLLGAVLRVTEPLGKLYEILAGPNGMSPEPRTYVRRTAVFAQQALADYEDGFDSPRFQRWHTTIASDSARLADA